jgi:hypothetical protein
MLAFDYTLYPFTVSFKPINRQAGSLREEVNTTVRLIAKSATAPLAVAFSGGIDSEVICRSLIEQEIDFVVFIMQYNDKYNEQDIEWAFKFCTQHKINPIVLNVDILNFIEQGAKPYIDQGYKSHEVFRYLQLWLMEQAEQQGYSLIMGGREDAISKHAGQPVIKYSPTHVMTHEWNKSHGNRHYPSFYETTPELIAAYLDSSVLKIVCQDVNYFVQNPLGVSPEKILEFQRAWPEMERRVKMNGFERLHPVKDNYQNQLRLQMPFLPTITLPIELIRQQLGLVNFSKIPTEIIS